MVTVGRAGLLSENDLSVTVTTISVFLLTIGQSRSSPRVLMASSFTFWPSMTFFRLAVS